MRQCLFLVLSLCAGLVSASWASRSHSEIYRDSRKVIVRFERLVKQLDELQHGYTAAVALLEVLHYQIQEMLLPENSLDLNRVTILYNKKQRAYETKREQLAALQEVRYKLQKFPILNLRLVAEYYEKLMISIERKYNVAERKRQRERMIMLRNEYDYCNKNLELSNKLLRERTGNSSVTNSAIYTQSQKIITRRKLPKARFK